MKNIMDTYLNFTEKKIRKYMKLILDGYYDEIVVNEYLRTYINARYYNIRNTEKPARAFYLRILDELEFKQNILIKRNEEEAENIEEKTVKLKTINTVKDVFGYILFFDNVRNVENFKNINSIKEIIKKIMQTVTTELEVKMPKDFEETFYKEITSDMLQKEIFLDKFETDEFSLKFESSDIREDLYYTVLEHNIKMPIQYSYSAIEKVYTEGIVAEDKLQIEYILLSLVAMRDIINGNFKDSYIAEFTCTLFKKKQKLDSILSLIENQALQEKINLNIEYSDYIKNQKGVLECTKKGYNFVITLDNSIKSIEDVERLKMFKLVIAPKNLVLYKEIKSDNSLNNVIYK